MIEPTKPRLPKADAIAHAQNSPRLLPRILKARPAPSSMSSAGFANLDAAHADELPVVDLPEPSACLRALLGFCRLGPPPALDAYDVAVLVLEGATKYEVAWARAGAVAALTRLAEAEPVRVYCAACRYGLARLAMLAARACLRVGSAALVACRAAELDWISTHQFRRLLHFVERCASRMEAHFVSGGWVAAAVPASAQRFWERACCGAGSRMAYDVRGKRRYPALWWEAYMTQVVAELRLDPSGQSVTLESAFKAFGERHPCQACCLAASMGMPRFVQTLKAQIAVQLSQASLSSLAS